MIISFLRAILLYGAIIGAIRLMGKRQISELQTSELVVTLLISDIAAIPMQDTSQPLVSGLLPIAVLVMCEIAISVGMVKSALFRKWICGRPILVIQNGKVDQKELRRLRMTIEDLSAQLRQQGIAHMDDVSYAIVETNGSLSVLKKPAQDVPTAQMLQLDPPDEGLELVVISDGKIFDVSLSLCGHTREWLDGILEGQSLSAKDIFIMTANTNGGFQITKKEEP